MTPGQVGRACALSLLLVIAQSCAEPAVEGAAGASAVCVGVTCSGHGTCVAGASGAVCVCEPGYEAVGLTCETIAGPCEGVGCGGGGVCVATAEGPRCLCASGQRRAPDGECSEPTDACQGVDCDGQGACITTAVGEPLCVCNPGFVADGAACVPAADPCGGITCSGHGACIPTTTGPACLCEAGYAWKGSECVANVDPCAEEDCAGHGACLVTPDGPACLCLPGFVAQGATCVPSPDPCVEIACSGHGTCVEVGGTPACLCDPGYSPQGTDCLAGDGPCDGVTCSGHGACVESSTGAVCVCDVGYYAAGTVCLEAPDTVIPVTAPSDLSQVVQDGGVPYVGNELIVLAEPGHDATALSQVVAGAGALVAAYNPLYRRYKVRLTAGTPNTALPELKQELQQTPGVALVTTNPVGQAGKVPEDAPWFGGWTEASPDGANWFLEAIGAPTAWSYSTGIGGEKVKLGIIDFDLSPHPDLVIPAKNQRLLPHPLPAEVSEAFAASRDHGTHVAGVAAATGDNGTGASGVLWGAEVLYCQTTGDADHVRDCFQWLVERGAQVINYSGGMSWRVDADFTKPWVFPDGEPTYQNSQEALDGWAQMWAALMTELIGHEWLFVQAAGNDAASDARIGSQVLSITDPALTARILVVGAATSDGELACYSNGGPIHLVAPGGDGPKSCKWLWNRQITFVDQAEESGTSFAAPLVAGTAALAWYGLPDATPEAIRNLIIGSAATTGGYPALDAAAALNAAASQCAAGADTVWKSGTGTCASGCSCQGKECGDDGCGAQCGPLGEGAQECANDVLTQCIGGQLVEVDCAAEGASCVDTGTEAECSSPVCVPSCAASDGCGPNGCGGSCGVCNAAVAACSPEGICVPYTDPPPSGEILWPAEGEVLTGDFAVEVQASDDTKLVKLSVLVSGPDGVSFKDSVYPGQATAEHTSKTVSVAGWSDGPVFIALWGLDEDNPAVVLDTIEVSLAAGPCVPDCAGKECGDDGCGGSCAPGCAGGETCSDAGLCEGTVAEGCDGGWCFISAGTFTMGSPAAEPCRGSDEGPQHEVTITRPFLMKQTEVTQAEWEVLVGNNPSSFSGCSDCPVESVNWYEAVYYCNELSLQEGLEPCYLIQNCSGKPGENMTCAVSWKSIGFDCEGYRLPTEAEWEYAARAGTTTAYWSGSNVGLLGTSVCGSGDPSGITLPEVGWYGFNAGGATHSVGQLLPNSWGLYDVHGNVYEWVYDRYDSDYYETEGDWIDPVGGTGGFRVSRGGSRSSGAQDCRSANRSNNSPHYRYNFLGFRPARSVP